MTAEFTLNAEARSDLGKGASRRLRRNASLVPAVIYGGDKAPLSISLVATDFAKLLANEAAFSHVLNLTVDGKKENDLIKAPQRHPAHGLVLPADFLLLVAAPKLTAPLPPHLPTLPTIFSLLDSSCLLLPHPTLHRSMMTQ